MSQPHRRPRRTAARLLLSAAACVVAVLPAPARAPDGNVRFSRLGLADGLSQGSVNAIVQDRVGLMWFATQDGLDVWDGYGVTVLKHHPDEPGTLSHSFVWTLLIDRGGVLWAGTDGGGLDRRNPDGSFTPFRNNPDDPASLSNDRVRILFEDRQGVLWVGTEQGLNRFDQARGAFERFLHDPADPASLSHDSVRAIYEDRRGDLWVGTYGGGLQRFDREQRSFTVFRHDPANPASLTDDQVRCMFEDRRGNFWIGTYESGLDRFDRDRGTFAHYHSDPANPRSLGHDRVRAIHEDSRGSLWIGTDGGLCRWVPEGDDFDCFHHDPADLGSLSDDRVMSIHEDRGGVLWIGTQGGLSKWNVTLGSFAHHRREPGQARTLSSNVITALYQDRSGTLWIGTYGGGLNALDRASGDYRQYRHDPADPASLSEDRVMSLLVDRQGAVWVGTFRGGLNRLDPRTGRFQRFRHADSDPTSLGADGVTSLLEDRQGRLWVGTHRGGLHRYDPASGGFVRWRHEATDRSSLSDDRVMALYEDGAGALWIGTDGGGLNRLDPHTGKLESYRHVVEDPTSLSSDVVWSILEGRDGTMWIGTQGGGLNRWDAATRRRQRGVFRRYTERDGLPNEFLYGILEDARGHLWMSSNRGIIRFDPQSETFRGYDVTHGLQSEEFNFGAWHRTPDGELLFGGNNGFNAFRPEQIRDNAYAPPVILTGVFKVNQKLELDRPVWELDRLRLDHRDSVVSFEFAALDFTAPAKNRFAYKLDGFDEDWIELGSMRRATYTNIPPGQYVFRVKASNNDGVWNENGIALPITAIPPPWRTWWAYTLYGLAVAGALAAWGRQQAWRLRREEDYSRKLEDEVRTRTTELAQRNTQLEEMNERLREASFTDSLTGLRNRRYLMTYLQEDIALAHRQYLAWESVRNGGLPPDQAFVFLMIDLDGLKAINDTHGHEAGDVVLTAVRERMIRACRESDTLIRWGGDEFLVVCRNTDRRAVERLAERLRRSLGSEPVVLPTGRTVRVSCSIGFSCYPFVPNRPTLVAWEKVLAVADRALYSAKHSGRNAWVGIVGTDRDPPDDLVQRLIEDTDALVQDGTVRVVSSFADASRLVWTA